MEPRIDPEFQGLMPAHDPEHLKALEESILSEGIRDPITMNGQGFILDGMTRFRLAKKHDLDYQTRYLRLPNRNAEMQWIINCQRSKGRQLTKQQEQYLLGKLYNLQKDSRGGDRKSNRQNVGLKKSGSTSEEIAKEEGVSSKTVERAGTKAASIDQLPANLKQDHLDGKVLLKDVEIDKLAKSDKLQQIARDVRTGAAKDVFEAYAKATGRKLRKDPKPPPPEVDQDADEVGPEEEMEEANREIETACRQLNKLWNELTRDLDQNNAWISDQGLLKSASASFSSALKALRSCKGVRVCPKCDGQGCKICRRTGWVTSLVSRQL